MPTAQILRVGQRGLRPILATALVQLHFAPQRQRNDLLEMLALHSCSGAKSLQ